MTNQTLKSLIRIAYQVKDDQVTGGPKWLDSDRYSVVAKTSVPADDAQILLMLQALLAERFRLSLHKETRPVTGYSLVIAKNGLKIRPVLPGPINQLNVKGGHMTAQAVSFDRLTVMLTNILHAPVSNDTHITELFDCQLDWTPDSGNAENPANDPAGGVSIFTALQDTLGLKLEARKVPKRFLSWTALIGHRRTKTPSTLQLIFDESRLTSSIGITVALIPPGFVATTATRGRTQELPRP
jgi:uncharacterized protein (TIGR03435 family)